MKLVARKGNEEGEGKGEEGREGEGRRGKGRVREGREGRAMDECFAELFRGPEIVSL